MELRSVRLASCLRPSRFSLLASDFSLAIMYDIKQFKPALYFVLILGMTGFALAVESPGLWVLSVGVIALHAWLVKSGRFRPLPRVLANAVTLVALVFTWQILRERDGSAGTTPIVVIGQFL